MSHTTVADELEDLLEAAAATMTSPTCGNVLAGEPTSVDRPVIAYWFMGLRPWETHTLGATQEEWRWHVRVYLPLGTRITPPRREAELWVAGLCSAIWDQMWTHVQAGSEATGKGVDIGDWTTGYTDVAGVTCRIADMDWGAQMANVSTIALGS